MGRVIKPGFQILLAPLLAAGLFGCDLFLTHGEEGQPCFKDQGACKPGLVCVAGTCRKPTSDGGLDGGDAKDGDDGGPAAIRIYRSVGPGNTGALASGGVADTLEISGMTAYFSAPLPETVGIGDALQYDSDGDTSVDALAFVHARASSTEFDLSDASGGQPLATTTATARWEIFRAYTSLKDALSCDENPSIAAALLDFDDAATVRNLAAADQVWNIACYADNVDDQNADISDWQTDETRYLRIFTPVDPTQAGKNQRHTGLWTPGAYAIEGQSDQTILRIGPEVHVRIEGLQIYLNNTAGTDGFCISSYSESTAWISANIIKGNGQGGSGIALTNGGATAGIWNNIIYDVANSLTGVGISLDSEMTAHVYNNTIYNTRIGIYSNGTEAPNILLINNLAASNTEYDFGDLYWGSGSSHNCSQDHSATVKMPDGTGGTSPSSVFVDFSGRNLHLKAGDTSCKNAGTDLSSDPHLPFDTDVDGQPRPAGNAWDIGADEQQ